MKRLLLSVTACLVWCAGWGQFALTPTGFVDKTSPDNDYIVLDCPGLSQEDLFDKAGAFFSSRYSVTSANAPETIFVSGFSRRAVADNTFLGGLGLLDIHFRMTVNFRDGRMRVMAPVVSLSKYRDGSENRTEVTQIKNKDGDVIGTEEKQVSVPTRHFITLYLSPYYINNGEAAGSNSSFIFNKKNKLKRPGAQKSLEDYFNIMVTSLHRHVLGSYEEW